MGQSVQAADAVKQFTKRNIQVQTARPASIKGADGKVRDGFEVKMKPLAAEHIMAASQDDAGVVTIVTIDGQRYRSSDKVAAEAAA